MRSFSKEREDLQACLLEKEAQRSGAIGQLDAEREKTRCLRKEVEVVKEGLDRSESRVEELVQQAATFSRALKEAERQTGKGGQ